MSVTEFTFRIFLLFFPGVLSALVIDRTIIHKKWTNFQFVIHAFFLGVLSYLLYFLFLALVTWSWPPKNGFLECLFNEKKPIDHVEILCASGIAILVSLLFIFLDKKKSFHRLLKRLKITNKFGELDVWSHVCNLDETCWVTVRDIKNDLVFTGWISAFSETHDENELFLCEVIVYRNSTSDELYETEAIYIARPKGELTIEFPVLEGIGTFHRNTKQE